jgi:hypothetical protein
MPKIQIPVVDITDYDQLLEDNKALQLKINLQ